MMKAWLAGMTLLQAASMGLMENSGLSSWTGIRTGEESERCMSKLKTSILNNDYSANAVEPRVQYDCPANNQDFREFIVGNVFLCCTQRTVAVNLKYFADGIDDIINYVDNGESFSTTRLTTRMLFYIHETFILDVQKGEVINGENPQNKFQQWNEQDYGKSWSKETTILNKVLENHRCRQRQIYMSEGWL
jgi:hypothetical protein